MRLRMKPRGLRALLLLPTLTVGSVAAGAFTQLPAQASTLPGTIEICKSAANGMTGQSFSFTYTDHISSRTISVLGGGCSAALSVTGTPVTVTEAQGGATVVQAIATLPKFRLVSSNLSTGTAVVRAPAGGTETVVTYTNVVPGAELKVCKQAAADSTQLNGQPFSFQINGAAAFTVNAGAFGTPICSALTNYAAGTNVTVRELQPKAGVSVSEIDVTQPPATNVSTNLITRTVSLTLGSGVNIVTYTNRVDVSAQKGWLEICKNASDQYVNGHRFSFRILDAAGLSYGPFSVLVGQCTPAIQVTSGPATITEAAQAPYFLSAVNVLPSGNFISANLTNGTATVSVVAGDQTTETAVSFVNNTELGFIKVCKALDSANSDALAGTAFLFNWSAALSTGGTPLTGTTVVVANTFEQGPACVFINGFVGLPLGSVVTISEVGQKNVVSSGTQTVTVPGTWNPDGNPGNNVTSVTFTNQADGTIEVCKTAVDRQTLGKPFEFSVNGGTPFIVNAGQCSLTMSVPAGTATVYEFPSTNYHQVAVTATGPTGASRLLSGFDPITVSVPFGGVGNETLVRFYNAVNTGQFKICKTTSEPQILGNDTFAFTYTYIVDNITFSAVVNLKPGECSDLISSFGIPVVDSAGNAVVVNVSEAPTPNVAVQLITYAGNGILLTANTAAGTSSFDIGLGVNTITYDNEVFLGGL